MRREPRIWSFLLRLLALLPHLILQAPGLGQPRANTAAGRGGDREEELQCRYQ